MDPSIYDALRDMFQPQPIDLEARQRQAEASHKAYGPRLEREAAQRRGQSDNRVANWIYDTTPGQPTKKEAITDLFDRLTPVGDVIHGEDTYQAAKEGNWGEAGLLAAMALPALLPAMPSGKRLKSLWHGSPTRGIKQFDSRFIGRGEGNAAYGKGLYFAENPKVAKNYRRELAGWEMKIGDKTYTDEHIPDVIDFIVAENTGGGRGDPLHKLLRDAVGGSRVGDGLAGEVSVLDALDHQFGKRLEFAKRNNQSFPTIAGHRAEYERARKVLQELNPSMRRGGAIYKVDIDALDTDFMPLDGTFKDMSPRHREAVRAILRGRYGDAEVLTDPAGALHTRDPLSETPEEWGAMLDAARRQNLGEVKPYWKAMQDKTSPYELGTAQRWLGGLADPSISQLQAAEDLFKEGVPGLRYFDGLSRIGEGSTRNFVVFDDSLIKIVKMYGVPAAVAAGVVSQADAERMEKEGLI